MKYQKVNGWWVYGHITPDGMIYIGCSGEKYVANRFTPSKYKRGSLYPYIEKYEWKNIKHIIFKDGLTQKQAEILEDLLIAQARIDNWCINKKTSGGLERDNRPEYHKQYYKNYYSTMEGKIYRKVSDYNRFHPDCKLITPLEAKEMYILTECIPDFIKNNL